MFHSAATAASLFAVMEICPAIAQAIGPEAKKPDGAALFKQQCGVCHTVNPADAPRQGPNMFKIVGRAAGKAEGFKYSTGLAQADFAWDDAKLDTWLTNPQAVIAGTTMAYRQAKPEIRAAIINYLKEQK